MKRLLLFSIIFLGALSTTLAQQQLHVSKYFGQNESIAYRSTTTEVIMSGESLRKYNQSLYHSISFMATEAEERELNALLTKDIAKAKVKEVKRIGGRVAVAFCLVGTEGETNQYLLYKSVRLRSKDGANVLLIYIEGELKPKELRKQFSF